MKKATKRWLQRMVSMTLLGAIGIGSQIGTIGAVADSYTDPIRSTKPFPTGVERVEDMKKEYTICTDTTRVSLAAASDGLYITSLRMNEGGMEYVPEASLVPMVKVINGGSVTWVYADAHISDVTNEDGTAVTGQKVTATYQSADGKYQTELTATAMNGVGPVEFDQYLTGITSGISVAYTDAIASDLLLRPDAETTLWSFGRLRMNMGDDPLFEQGGSIQTSLKNGDVSIANVENSCNAASGYLPYEVLDMGDHGVYFGYYWCFGKMMVSRSDDKVAICTWLGDDAATIEREVGVSLSIPGFFVGTYEGDVDDGSNDMKHWYWEYKITRSLYEHEEEPYLSACIDYDAINVRKLLKYFPDIANYINVLKYDYNWTFPADGNWGTVKETDWIPAQWVLKADGSDNTKWELYDIIKEHAANDGIDADLKLSLYMSYTYQSGDIGTKEGREAQLQALKERYDPKDNEWGIGYDYWRSDFILEGDHDYDSHEGLLYILDSMIAYSDEFRYEHCSAGGSLKDFTSLERITFMTTEDFAMPLFHRQSLYANTYMISPVQLRADINCLIDTEWGAGGRGYISVDENGNGIPADTDPEYVDYFLRTCMLGTGLITFDIAAFRANMETIKRHCDLYNTVQRKILRNCNVYHILDAPTGYDYDDWDGIMYYNDTIDKGVVQLFKCNSEVGGVAVPSERTILLKGLDADTSYTLTFIDRTEQNCVMTGAELMNTGLHVTGMTEKYDSEIIYIEPYEVLADSVVISGRDTMIVGETDQLNAAVMPEEATNTSVTWKSSDETVAAVDEHGVVTAISEGTVQITATTTDGSEVFGTLTLTIKAHENTDSDSMAGDATADGGGQTRTGCDSGVEPWVALAAVAATAAGEVIVATRKKKRA